MHGMDDGGFLLRGRGRGRTKGDVGGVGRRVGSAQDELKTTGWLNSKKNFDILVHLGCLHSDKSVSPKSQG